MMLVNGVDPSLTASQGDGFGDIGNDRQFSPCATVGKGHLRMLIGSWKNNLARQMRSASHLNSTKVLDANAQF